jgi:hypothetical protein
VEHNGSIVVVILKKQGRAEETMPKAMAAVFALVLAVSVVLPAGAQTPSTDTREQAAVAFADAASTYEDIVNLFLNNRTGVMQAALGSVREVLTRLRPSLNEHTAATLDRHLKEMETAEAKGDITTTALTAAESFRTVVTATTPQMRRTPIELSMYAYWAYRLVVLGSDAKSNWPEMTQSAKESERSWILLREMVRDTNVRLLLEENQRGMAEAVARNDAAGVKFAARVQIASTAVLGNFFGRIERTAEAAKPSGKKKVASVKRKVRVVRSAGPRMVASMGGLVFRLLRR